MNRYRLLYFIVYYRGKLLDQPNLKAQLSRIFYGGQYGHLDADWTFLFREGLLDHKGEYIVATKKARRELSFLVWGKVMQAMMIVAGAALLLFYFTDSYHLTLLGIQLSTALSVYAVGIFLIVFGIASHYILSDYTPKLPSKDETRGLL